MMRGEPPVVYIRDAVIGIEKQTAISVVFFYRDHSVSDVNKLRFASHHGGFSKNYKERSRD